MIRPDQLCGQGLSYTVSDTKILSGVDCTLSSGEVVALIGPNGAGKSTLLRMLAGELSPTSGRVTMGERALLEFSRLELAHRRCVMTQSTHLAFDFLVSEVLQMGWLGPQHTYANALKGIVRVCDLQELFDRHYNSLSGGEQQRVQFARAMLQLGVCIDHEVQPGQVGQISSTSANTPLNTSSKFMLLDEPTASLDIAHELSTLKLVRHIAGCNVCVVVVLHDLNLAARFADQLILLKEGQVVVSGAPDKVLQADILSAVYNAPLRVEHHSNLNRLVVYS